MRKIFYSLLLGNLAYMALSIWGQGTGRVSANELAGKGAFKNPSPRISSSFEQKSARIQLPTEAGHSGVKSGVEVVLEQPTLVAAPNDLKSCLGLGPFENVISAQAAAGRLRAAGHFVEMTAVDTLTGESDYRVVMPPLSSQQEAFRRFRELESRGIDSFVITKGVNAFGISLGVFSSSGTAESYRQELIGLGYDVTLDVLPRVNRGYWVQTGQGMFPEELLFDIDVEFIGVEVTETGCMN